MSLLDRMNNPQPMSASEGAVYAIVAGSLFALGYATSRVTQLVREARRTNSSNNNRSTRPKQSQGQQRHQYQPRPQQRPSH